MFSRKHVCLLLLVTFVLTCRFCLRTLVAPFWLTPSYEGSISRAVNQWRGKPHLNRPQLTENIFLKGNLSTPLESSTKGIRLSSAELEREKSEEVPHGEQNEWRGKKALLKAKFQRRKNHVTEMCRKFLIHPASSTIFGEVDESRCQATRRGSGYSECIFTNNFSLARSASSLSCLNNKVASTSIVSSMLSADGSFKVPPTSERIGESPHMYLPYIVPKNDLEFEFARKYFFKFMVVRHPFRRLLSAFRDKVEKAPHWTLLELRKDIYDHKHKLNRFASSFIKENEFPVKENGKSSSETILFNNTNLLNTNSDFVPTFEEFLNYILSFHLQGQGYESHWVPYWRRCAPCSIQYDVIAKLEMAPLEMEYIWERMMVEEIPWENKSDEKKREEEEMLRRYYSELSTRIIMDVYSNYFLDFMLFDYDIRDVLQLGNHCTGNGCDDLLNQYGYHR